MPRATFVHSVTRSTLGTFAATLTHGSTTPLNRALMGVFGRGISALLDADDATEGRLSSGTVTHEYQLLIGSPKCSARNRLMAISRKDAALPQPSTADAPFLRLRAGVPDVGGDQYRDQQGRILTN